MRKILLLLSVFLCTVLSVKAQQSKLESARVAYISSAAELSAEESEKFWPIYNDFRQEKRTLRKAILKLRLANKDADEKTFSANMKKISELRKAEIDLDERYQEKFTKVIGTQKWAAVYAAEQDFNRKLLKKLAERKGRRLR